MERDNDIIIESTGAWFVWTKRGRAPKFAHPTREAAMAEAQRLASLNPGKKFHVMQSVAKVSVVLPADPAPEIPKEVWDQLEPNAVIDAHRVESETSPLHPDRQA